jgi:hypothetical protein
VLATLQQKVKSDLEFQESHPETDKATNNKGDSSQTSWGNLQHIDCKRINSPPRPEADNCRAKYKE